MLPTPKSDSHSINKSELLIGMSYSIFMQIKDRCGENLVMILQGHTFTLPHDAFCSHDTTSLYQYRMFQCHMSILQILCLHIVSTWGEEKRDNVVKNMHECDEHNVVSTVKEELGSQETI